MIKKFELGSIEYRYPGAMETMDFVGDMSGCETVNQQIRYIVNNMGPLVKKVSVKTKGKTVKKLDELLECSDVNIAVALVDIANDIFSAMFVSDEVKKA